MAEKAQNINLSNPHKISTRLTRTPSAVRHYSYTYRYRILNSVNIFNEKYKNLFVTERSTRIYIIKE